MTPVAAPSRMEWPGQRLPEGIAGEAGGALASRASMPLWTGLRRQVLDEIHAGLAARRRRRFLISAAAALLLSVAGLRFFSVGERSLEAPEPVFVRLSSPPPGAEFISPGLAFRSAMPK
ncbi:MAG: hypothetical protein Fur0037_09370 [Planctomycetota bacterium]